MAVSAYKPGGGMGSWIGELFQISNSLSLGRPETFGALAEQFQKMRAVGVVGADGFGLLPASRNAVPASGPINACFDLMMAGRVPWGEASPRAGRQ